MKQTTLDLNGPIISFVQQPVSIGVCNSGIATFVGVATASFPTQTPANPATNTGSLSYQWYAEGFGPLSDGSFQGATIAGSATTTLTLSGVISPTLSGIQFYVGVDYVPSAYSQPAGSSVTVGTGRSTGNAINEIFNSDLASLTVFPDITITSQPTSRTAAQRVSATFSITAVPTDTTQGNLSYQWTANGTVLNNGNTTINGGAVNTSSNATTNNLTVSSNTVGIQTVQCLVSHPTSCSSPVYSNTVNFTVVEARSIVNYEQYIDSQTSILRSGSQNLFNGPLRINANSSEIQRSTVIYPPEKDIRVRITLAGAAGQSLGGTGGQGGVSIFEYTLRRNTEYNVKLGGTSPPTGGANGGGGAAFIYNKSGIIAICGGGGAGGSSGRGGRGGGIGIGGETGLGRSGGQGGQQVSAGSLPVYGYFPGGNYLDTPARLTATTGGRVSSCSFGDYWANNGFSPCTDFGSSLIQARNSAGSTISGSASLLRGFKPGNRGHRLNGGNGSGGEGGAGSGAYGGNAGTGGGSGGGGGSGYSSGNITIISSQLGGNTLTGAYIIIEAI